MELARALQVTTLVLALSALAQAVNIKCPTPNSTEGECKSLDDCPSMLQMKDTRPLTAEIITHLRLSQCDYDELYPKVCCPTSSRSMPFHLPERQNRSQSALLNNRFKPDEGLPGLNVCGRQLTDNKIFGGEITAIDEFPWMALLEYNRKLMNNGFACGGALITDRFVLTAAHCVSEKNLLALGGLKSVRLGEYNIETEPDCDSAYPTDCADAPIDVAVAQIIIHPDYDEETVSQYNDIALIKLEKSVRYTDFVRPICLSKKLPSAIHRPGHVQYVAGWGQTELSRNSPIKLKLKVPVVENGKCANKYQPFGVTVRGKQLCAGGEREKDSCAGDSGGPLMVKAVNNSTGDAVWYATGIVSIGPTPCATDGIPGVYTKVFDYMDWILSKIRT